MRNISPSNRKPSAAGSGFRTEDLWVTCRPPYPLCHSGYPSDPLISILTAEYFYGIGVDQHLKRIHLVDVARTMDHAGDLLTRRGAGKVWKYEALRRDLAKEFPDHAVVVREFIVGELYDGGGSISEDRWVFHLTALGIGKGDQ